MAEGIGDHDPVLREAYVLISYGGQAFGAKVKSICPGDGVVLIDSVIRQDLKVPEEEAVDVQPLAPRQATSVSIGIGEEILHQKNFDRLCHTYLYKQPLSRGQSRLIFLLANQDMSRDVQVSIEDVTPGNASVMTDATVITFIPSARGGRGATFGDIGGLDREIRLIRERVELPIRQADRLMSMGIYPPRGVLLYGPPGCGKTLIARALCNEIGANFYLINASETFHKYYGESEKRLVETFKKARENAPSMILIDEIDAIGSARETTHGELERRIVTTLLSEMDGLKSMSNVIVVGTTNDIGRLDPALRRPGRFDYEIRIGIPDAKGRESILDPCREDDDRGPGEDAGEGGEEHLRLHRRRPHAAVPGGRLLLPPAVFSPGYRRRRRA